MDARPRWLPIGLLAGVVTGAGCLGVSASQDAPVILATTTSTYDSGLLDDLAPRFEEETGYRVDVIAVGSGQAIELGRRGEADVVLAHSPAAEQELVDAGVTGGRDLVMYNDFVVVGPTGDPAKVGDAASIEVVMERLAKGTADVISRGDDSGTHALERSLWERASVDPEGPWYRESGQGMGATLRIAAEEAAYTLSDRGTFLATELQEGLEIVYEDDPALVNLYHVIPITERAGERVQVAGGRSFADWILRDDIQELIADFGVEEYGRPLFIPAAGRDAADLHDEGSAARQERDLAVPSVGG